ncbi:hypothetical protein DEO72_LG7g330 [Vigna unguiculata]|uniref:Uncharacterized protein n=1 Tax=Vigna unguiculata TaxID=3917 RepID=A0A4D6MF15_VIGUN|nr:hypothetical protein DEO72_LG7g330 [Vigna unguiculata]
MLDVECDKDEVVCSTMLSSYARWGCYKFMLSFYSTWPLAHLSGAAEYAFKTSDEMRNNGVRPEEVTQSV